MAVTKLIIFDWDDVFSQGSTEGYIKCYRKALEKVGAELSHEEFRERVREVWGGSHQQVLAHLLKDQPELLDDAIKTYEEHLFGDTFIDGLFVLPGSAQMLKRLSKKYKLALATGIHPKVLLERVMPKFNIPNVFAQIITAYDLADPTQAKPNAYIAETIMKEQDAKPEETVVVGDATNDVLMARSAGAEPVVVLTGHLTKEQAKRLNVKYILDDITKLETVLTAIG